MIEIPPKRESVLKNTELRNDTLRQLLEDFGDCVPSKVWMEFEDIEEKTRQARMGIATDKGEHFVDKATSAQASFVIMHALSGLKSVRGGWNTQYIRGGWNGAWHADAIKFARTMLPEQRPLPRGTKSQIAIAVAERFDMDFHHVRRVLRDSDIYD